MPWIEVATEGHDAIAGDFREYPARLTRAMVRSLNRGISSARTLMVREIARDTGMRSSDVRAALVMTEATILRPETRLAASNRRIPLIQFSAHGPEPSRGRGRGVSYRLPGGRGRNEHAFIATMRSDHRGVFRRVGTLRLPIVELFGPSLGHVFKKFEAAARARAQEQFQTNLRHELDRVTGD